MQCSHPGGELDHTPTIYGATGKFPLQEGRAYAERLGQGDERLRLRRQVQGMGVPHPIDGIECDEGYNPFGGDGDLQRTDVPGTTQGLYGAPLLGSGVLYLNGREG